MRGRRSRAPRGSTSACARLYKSHLCPLTTPTPPLLDARQALKSATRLNIDLCAAVLSDVRLLESISAFKRVNAAYFAQRLQVPSALNPHPELLGPTRNPKL